MRPGFTTYFLVSLNLSLVGMPALAATTIIVQTPASLTEAFDDLSTVFEKANPGVKVDLNIGASNILARQVEQGAPADVMTSADRETMDGVDGRGLIETGTRKDFVRNTLVLVVPKGGVRLLTWKELPVHPAVYRIAIGDKGVPVGKYTHQVFEAVGISKAIHHKLVPAADVRQVLAYVSQGEVDAGVVFSTDAKAGKGRVRVVDRPPPKSHEPIVYPIAVVKASKNRDLGRKWIDLILSEPGQKILKNRGFIPLAMD